MKFVNKIRNICKEKYIYRLNNTFSWIKTYVVKSTYQHELVLELDKTLCKMNAFVQ